MMNLRAALMGLLLLAPLVAGDTKHSECFGLTGGKEIQFLGKSPKFIITAAKSNSTLLRVDFGRIAEKSADGQLVQGHKIPSLASEQVEYSAGSKVVGDVNASYVTLRLPLSTVSTSGGDLLQCPSGASPAVSNLDANSFVGITIYFGMEADTTFPFGYNNTVTSAANSTKFSIEAAKWPFCSQNNTLEVQLELRTGAGRDARPKQTNWTADDADYDGAVAESASRAQPANQSRKHGGAEGPGQSERQREQRGVNKRHDPRVAGRMVDRVALLTGANNSAAALDLESYAYDDVNGTVVYNVSSVVQENEDHTTILLTFPAFDTIYYDPTISVGVNATDVGYTEAEINTATTTTTTKNAAGRAVSSRLAVLVVVWVLALL